MPPPELLLEVLGYVVAPALLAAAVILAVSLRVYGAQAAGLGTTAAFLVGCFAANYLRGTLVPWLPDRLGWHWLLWVTMFAMLVGLAARGSGVPTLAGWLLRALTAGHAAWLLVPTGLQNESIWVVPSFALIIFVEWGVLELLANKLPGGALPLATSLAFLAAAAVLVHAHSARMADIAIFASAAFFGIAVVASLTQVDIGAAMPAVAVMLPGLLLSGYYETVSQVPWRSFALIGLAPMVLIISLSPLLLRLHPLLSRAILMALLLVPCAIAVALAIQAEPLEF